MRSVLKMFILVAVLLLCGIAVFGAMTSGYLRRIDMTNPAVRTQRSLMGWCCVPSSTKCVASNNLPACLTTQRGKIFAPNQAACQRACASLPVTANVQRAH